MGSNHSIPVLDGAGLRRFALTTGGLVAILFGLVLPWFIELPLPIWPWVLASILIVWGLIAPLTLHHVYRTWMLFGLAMNRIMSPLVMSLVFFAVITPMGVVRRLLGHDMPKYRDPQKTSYRINSRNPDPEDLQRPF